MPVINRFADFQRDLVEIRHDLHRHPELLYEVHRTASTVADRLRSYGLDEVVTGIGRTGVVGVIRGRKTGSGRVIGLRADMDALPVTEANDTAWISQNPGLMHACGHDGHTTMLLGAARYLSETRNFDGTAVVIFQPAEEGGAGGLAMVEDGMMERFGIEEVYGLHNMPGIPIGTFGIRNGPILAAADDVQIEIHARGGHAAKPHNTVDPIVVASAIVQGLQSIVSRTVDPLDSAVVSITMIQIGNTHNVIADYGKLIGTARTLRPEVRDHVERQIKTLAGSIAAAYGATATVTYRRHYPVTRNHTEQTRFAARVAAKVAGAERVDTDIAPVMGGEDFSYMLEARPGAFIFMGNGDSSGLHSPTYDFSDEAIPIGCSYWAKLVEEAMPA
ncbi:MAG: amidohydrolase [Bauldia sp.]|nr:amidohydrolase [Bauldia sp.]